MLATKDTPSRDKLRVLIDGTSYKLDARKTLEEIEKLAGAKPSDEKRADAVREVIGIADLADDRAGLLIKLLRVRITTGARTLSKREQKRR